jgi:hypothetical protein
MPFGPRTGIEIERERSFGRGSSMIGGRPRAGRFAGGLSARWTSRSAVRRDQPSPTARRAIFACDFGDSGRSVLAVASAISSRRRSSWTLGSRSRIRRMFDSHAGVRPSWAARRRLGQVRIRLEDLEERVRLLDRVEALALDVLRELLRRPAGAATGELGLGCHDHRGDRRQAGLARCQDASLTEDEAEPTGSVRSHLDRLEDAELGDVRRELRQVADVVADVPTDVDLLERDLLDRAHEIAPQSGRYRLTIWPVSATL